MELTEEEKGVLMFAARDSIHSLFGNTPEPIINYDFYPHLKEKGAGAFVTITIKNNLRGCIGYMTSNLTLYETVCDAAKQAAMNDPRFPPLSEEELEYINIEVSVLSHLVRVNNYEEIVPGVHGLVLEEGEYRGVLLPQVATENKYTLPQFLEALCLKAGLAPDAWETGMLNIYSFTATVFSELGRRKKTYERN